MLIKITSVSCIQQCLQIDLIIKMVIAIKEEMEQTLHQPYWLETFSSFICFVFLT